MEQSTHLEGDKSLLHLERILANVSLNKPSAGLYKLHLDQVTELGNTLYLGIIWLESLYW